MAVCGLMTAQAQKCLTDKVNYDILNSNIEKMILHQQFYQSVPKGNSAKRVKYIIPVVFHVIHTNGPENISKEQIEDQIRVLNEDYSYTNANKSNIRSIFQGVAADFDIEFRLAKIDPQGNCTDGINRIYSPSHVNAHDEVKKLSLGRWPNERYLNIWTVSSINSAGAPGIVLGYAYFPSTSAGATFSYLDGVVVRADYVGTIGTSNSSRAGRTLTHEVGHYLGLKHPFQDSCDGGDDCDDTPPVAETFTNAACNPSVNSCHNDNPDLPDMFENYMDYSEGFCQAMFTQDQKSIVYHTFEFFEHRKKLVSEENLIATGVLDQAKSPLAGFDSDIRTVCAGKSVQFYETACVSPASSRTWTFEGGNITTSAAAKPVVTYNTPGQYKVSLTVTNAYGTGTLTKDQYIVVLPGEAIDKGYLMQTFESPDFEPGEGWILEKRENVPVFKRLEGTAYSGNACLFADNNALTRKGTLFAILSPKVDLRPLAGQGPKLSFMCAYAQPNTTSTDVLRVYSSTDCGNTWTLRFTRSGTNLYSVSTAVHGFVPGSKLDWKRHSVALNFAQTEPNIMFKIEFESDKGGPLYIDNINVSQYNTDLDDITIVKDMSILPVPNNGQFALNFSPDNGGTAMIEVRNTLGQVVYSGQSEVFAGEQNLWLNLENLADGVHFVTVSLNGEIRKATFVVAH